MPRGDKLTEAPEVLGLIVEWYDALPQLVRQYIFKVMMARDAFTLLREEKSS